MFLDLINMDKVRRAALCGVYMLLVLLAQDLVLSRITILGARALILPAAAVSVGMFLGGVWGGVFGLALGFFADMSFGSSVMFTLVFPFIGFFSGVAARWYVNKSFFAYLCVTLAASVLTVFCQMFWVWVILDQPLASLLATAGKQVLWSVPLAAPLYFPGRGIAAKGRPNEQDR